MNILPKKSWHVRNKDNVARVRRDEAQAAEEEREVQRRVERAEQEARTEYLRQKSRAALQLSGGWSDGERGEGNTGVVEHLNLFPLEESAEKKGNEEYLKEKKDEKEREERAIGLLVSLGPQPGTEVTPWYMKTGQEKEEKDQDEKKQKEKEKDNKGKRPTLTQEEKEKRDKRLKDMLDPLREMKKALAVKDRKEHKSKKRNRMEKRTSAGGESSIEKLRAERLQREAEERRRAQALLDQRNGTGKEKRPRELEEREMPYNSAYFPELARKRQRKDRDAWRDGIF
ncbi:leukocyte receptor cluster member 1 [Esox lucius]|uniref:CBF1-interacting co-repressor CIR N-terminal domain-containing protein n=1 Tax=Esox lucius TaxID=8010 RepID=A0A3P9A3N2_ESOLU|nr:leukocyte receptor cluster member 1 [Esox lucius]